MYDIKIYPTSNYSKLPFQKYVYLKKEKKKEDLSFKTILKDKMKEK